VHLDFVMAAATTATSTAPPWYSQIPILSPAWNALVAAIFYSLAFFYQYLGSAGLAIIALTIVVRILMIPLTWKQTKSMIEMQRIQPKLKELQAKYKNDAEKLQQETMKFYQDNKVNPFGGCLPLLIQMPVFIALYQVLAAVGKPDKILGLGLPPGSPLAVDVPSFYVVIPNIARSAQQVFTVYFAHGVNVAGIVAMIPYVILIILFAVSIYVPQMMTTTDPQQRRIECWRRSGDGYRRTARSGLLGLSAVEMTQVIDWP